MEILVSMLSHQLLVNICPPADLFLCKFPKFNICMESRATFLEKLTLVSNGNLQMK